MINFNKALIAGSLVLSLGSLAAYANPGSHKSASKHQFEIGFPSGLTGLPPGRLRSRIEALPPAAQKRALEWLQRFSFPEEDLNSLYADDEGAVFYKDEFVINSIPADQTVLQEAGEADSGAATSEGMTSSEVFSLHSNPGAANVVYLDFNGYVIQNTAWNNGSSAPIYAHAFDLDGDPNTFNQLERDRIAETWHRIAEDYAPFNIDVTTEEPVSFGPSVGRILITRDTDTSGAPMPAQGAGGVAYVGVFGESYYQSYSPALVYYNNLGAGYPAYMAEAASHELGHNLALSHDGTSTAGYYTGHGTGYVSWAPIMGVGYYASVTQWSKGEYVDANNSQDDLAILSARLGYVFDDHDDSYSGATLLAVAADGSINGTNPQTDPGNSQTHNKGVIGTGTDTDFFSFEAGAGLINITATPAWDAFYLDNLRGANLDIQLALYNSQDLSSPIAVSDPLNETEARIQISVPSGSFYLAVSAVGNNVSPYSDYASLGQYFISGTVAPVAQAVNNPPVANDDFISTSEDSQISVPVLSNDSDADGDVLTISAAGSATNGMTYINGTQIVYVPANNFNGSDSFTYTVSDGKGGTHQAMVTMTVVPVNDAPIATDDSASMDQGGVVTIGVLMNDTDIDDLASALFVSSVSAASHGQLQISADLKSVIYTPDANYAGSDSFSYTVSDATGVEASATVSIDILSVVTVPVMPGIISATDGQNGNALLNWTDNSTNENGFQIERQKQHRNGRWVGSTFITAMENTTSLIDASGTGSFRYRIMAENEFGVSGWSDWSNVVVITSTSGSKKDNPKKGGGKK